MSDNALYEQLQALQKTKSETLIRDLEIELLGPERKLSKKGRSITSVAFRYRDPSSNNSDWKNRSIPIFSDEAIVLLTNGPYKKGALYRVSAKKNARNFWQWESIEQAANNEAPTDA